jgi:hypothetical protein
MAEVVFLQGQLRVASGKIEKLTEKNKLLHLQLEVSDARCNELLLEVQLCSQKLRDFPYVFALAGPVDAGAN